MPVDSCETQLQQAARRGGLVNLFGDIEFAPADVADVSQGADGQTFAVRFSNASGLVGMLHIDLYDTGNPDEAGLTLGLRGWQLDENVASV